jgi:hypothetical protein
LYKILKAAFLEDLTLRHGALQPNFMELEKTFYLPLNKEKFQSLDGQVKAINSNGVMKNL